MAIFSKPLKSIALYLHVVNENLNKAEFSISQDFQNLTFKASSQAATLIYDFTL